MKSERTTRLVSTDPVAGKVLPLVVSRDIAAATFAAGGQTYRSILASLLLSTAGLAAVMSVSPAVAENSTWDGTSSADWDVGTNWTDNTAPVVGDDIAINVTPADPPFAPVIISTTVNSDLPGSSLVVGVDATGVLTIEDGGTLNDTSGYIAFDPGSEGTVTVTGTGSIWMNSEDLRIGVFGTGTLTIANGGTISNGYSIIADETGSTGAATVTGAGSTWTNDTFLSVSDEGTGTLTIANGGAVSDTFAQIGAAAGSMGTATVTGPGSIWTNTGALYIGLAGTGALTIEDGGTVTNTIGNVAFVAGSEGTVTVTGTGSQWTNTSDLSVGYDGTGALTIENGGMVSNVQGYVGATSVSEGMVTVTGTDTQWTNTGDLFVGYDGTGALTIENGGTVSNVQGYVGRNFGSQGTVTVTGSGSTWTTSSYADVGYVGTGTLTIESGGMVSSNGGSIGYGVTSDGTATVTGSGSMWTNADDLLLGFLGTGRLTIADGGEVSAPETLVAENADSTGVLNIGAATGDAAAAPGMLDSPALTFGAGAGALVFNHTDTTGDYEFASNISGGSGTALIAHLAGYTKLTGDSSGYAGTTLVDSGMLAITGGGLLGDSDGYIGESAGMEGAVLVSGAGSAWAHSNNLFVGYGHGTGTLTIEDGGTVSNGGYGLLGWDSDSVGIVTVTGSDSEWSNSVDLLVGFGLGTGMLTVENGATVSNVEGYIADSVESVGAVTVTGAGSTWTSSSLLYVGNYGTGTLTIENGGTVINHSSGYIGYEAGSEGAVTVTGAGSTWMTSDPGTTLGSVFVGEDGTGTLTIENGGTVITGSGYIANKSLTSSTVTSEGSVTVTGSGSTLTTATYLVVGDDGTGTLTIADGGTVTTGLAAFLGTINNAEGTATVTGAGSEWTISGGLLVGNRGIGTLTVENGGTVSNTDASIGVTNAFSAFSPSVGTVTVTGAGSTWTNSGTLRVGKGSTGTVTIVDDGAVSAAATTIGNDAGSTGTLNIGAAAGDNAAAPGMLDSPTVTFGDGTGTLVFNHTETSGGYEFASDISSGSGTATIAHYAGFTSLTGDGSGFSGSIDIYGGTLSVQNTLGGALSINGGTLGGNGTVGDLTVDNGGTVAPGNSIGTITVDGNYVQGADGVLQIEFGPTGSNDLVVVSGTADVDGTLSLILFDPNVQIGDTFVFLTAGDGVVDGVFDDIVTPDGLLVDVTASANQIQIEIVGLTFGGCEQTDLDVLCTGIDGDGFENLTDTGLDVFVEPDALVLSTSGNGLTLGDGNTTDNQGTINVGGDGIHTGNSNVVTNTSNDTIIAGGSGVVVGDDSQVTNIGTINAGTTGIQAGDGGEILNQGTINSDGEGIIAGSNYNPGNSLGSQGIINSGTINAGGDGIQAGDNTTVTNSSPGTILADENGIVVGDNSMITNTGTIEVGFRAIDTGTNAMVSNTGTITALGDDGVNVGSGSTVSNSGTITADEEGIEAGDDNGGGPDKPGNSVQITNLAAGEITAGEEAIEVGSSSVVDNYGTLMAGDDGIAGGDNGVSLNQITNHAGATITATNDGIDTDDNGSGGDIIINDGTINAGDAGIDADSDSVISNTGTINSSAAGIEFAARNTVLNEVGATIQAQNGSAILVEGENNLIVNGGLLTSANANGIEIDAGVTGLNEIENVIAGTIEGATVAIQGSNGVESVLNNGMIEGDVLLSGGDDSFTTDVSMGTVNGTIDGGTGTDSLTLNGTGSFAFDQATNFDSLSIENGAAVTATGTGNDVGTASIDATSALTLAAGSTLTTSGGLTVANGAVLNGTGTVDGNVMSSGTVAAGNSIGMLTITGDYAMDADGVLEVEFGPTGQNDLLVVGGAVTLAGTLDLYLVDQNVEVGDIFTIITAVDGVTGSFDAINNINGIGEFDVVIGANSVQIEVLFLEGCIQSGSNVLCTGTDPDGFTNIVDDGLDTYVEPDAIVNNPEGNGLTLGNNGTVDNPGTIDVAGNGIDVQDGNTIDTSGTIVAGGTGINAAGQGNTITNSGTIEAMGDGVTLESFNSLTNNGQIDAGENGVFAVARNTIVNNATITADGNGVVLGVDLEGEGAFVFLDGVNTLTNNGTIVAGGDGVAAHSFGNVINNNSALSITGGDDGVDITGNENTLNNNGGAITGGDTGEGHGHGVDILGDGNTVNNTGGSITSGDGAGISATGANNAITNSDGGTITGSQAGIVLVGEAQTEPGAFPLIELNSILNGTGSVIEGLEGPGVMASGPTLAIIENAGGTIIGGTGDEEDPVLAIQGGEGQQSVINRNGGLIMGDIALGGDSDLISLETGSVIDGDIDMGEDEGDADSDTFELNGTGVGAFDGDATGVELLNKVDSGSFDLNGTVAVGGVALFRDVEIDTDGDGVTDDVVQVFDRVMATTIDQGRLNVGGLVLVDDDDDPETDPVLAPNTAALLVSPVVDVMPGGTLGGHGTVVTDPALLGGVFVSGKEVDPFNPTGEQGSIAPGTSLGTLTVVGRVVFDSVATEVIDDVTVVTNNGGRFEVDLNDSGGHDLLNVVAAGVASTMTDVPVDTTGPEDTSDGVFDGVESQSVATGDGTATLGGTIDVILDPEFLDADEDGTPDVDDDGNRIPTADYRSQARIYDVLVAENGVSGTFDNVAFDGGPNDGAVVVQEDNPATTEVDETTRIPLLKGALLYLSDRVRIVTIPDFTPSAETPNQSATAAYIDGFTQFGLNQDPLHELVAELGLSSDIPGGLDDLHPEWFNAFNEVGFATARTLLHQTGLRSNEVRGGRGSPRSIAINVTDNSAVGRSGEDNRASFWLAGAFSFSDVDSDQGFIEYEFDTASGYAGFDYRVSDNVLVGLAGGFGSTDVDFKGRSGQGDVDSWQIAGYLSVFGPNWFADLAGGFGDMNIDSLRDITFSSVNLMAAAKYDGDFAYVGGRGGYNFTVGDGIQVTPTIGLTYVNVKQDGFTETGAAPANLVVDAQDFDSVRLEGVVRIAKSFRTGNDGWVIPYVRVGVGHEFEDDTRQLTARFEAVPNSQFTVLGDVPRRTTALFGAGISGMIGPSLMLYLDYAGEIGGDYTDHTISGGAKLMF